MCGPLISVLLTALACVVDALRSFPSPSAVSLMLLLHQLHSPATLLRGFEARHLHHLTLPCGFVWGLGKTALSSGATVDMEKLRKLFKPSATCLTLLRMIRTTCHFYKSFLSLFRL